MPLRLIVAILVSISLFLGCSQNIEKKKYKIGLSQCMLDDAWRQAMLKEAYIEALNYDSIEIIVKDANSDNDRQIAQIRELIKMDVDVLIISPFQSAPITPVAEEAYKAGIPTIITDRKINSELYTTFVGADNYAIGHAAGKYAINQLPPNARILEIWGLAKSSPAQERHQGFIDALISRSDLRFSKIEADWLYKKAKERLDEQYIPDDIDFVYSHNDMMAIAAREYFIKYAPEKANSLQIIGVDAVPGAGLEAVADGRIDASFTYPTAGEEVIRTAIKILNGEEIEKEIKLRSVQIGKNNAETLLIQAEQLLNYQRRIENQRIITESLISRFNFLRNSFSIISLLMLGFVLLSIYIYFINRKMKKTNQILVEINRKEEEQRKKLIELNAEIENVTAQKLQFFTNVSHEVRTPLTLILDPLDKLTRLMHDSPYFSDLQLMQKNANRLLRVINQILDFRKVERNQEALNIRHMDIVSLAGEVKSYFESVASLRNIQYAFHTNTKNCLLWFDTDMIEKVLVNLVSNAFKFTPQNGQIDVSIRELEKTVEIEIKDNGQGIDPQIKPFIFDRFYTQGQQTGTGIGLHLVKEYIQLHKGAIRVDSNWGKGSSFIFSLSKGKAHFAEEVINEFPASPLAYDASVLDDSEEKALLELNYDYTILIVEDDEEVRIYLNNNLKENFNILVATNGKEALEIIQKHEISLVLSDVMMPEMNGFELCRLIKSDISCSHIPVILLTALSDSRQRNFGLSLGADDYIQKPFQITHIKIKIIRQLQERERMRTALLNKLQQGSLLLIAPDKTENIDDLFLNRFIGLLENIYTDPDFNIEKASTELGLSRGHLSRKIKELTGITPVEFLRNFRLTKATILLKQQQLSISEITYQTGFSSPAYFTKCFRAVYGVTPSDYK
ncbi:hybrid sensor histidine kinase/response regulator transcription factor [Massilibacteroides vaginae]|uniref:hybrid sensor histidine kinase/response regulator transcription factor n=1 Tax=Massilibacteroides vaginae TaxID=1673718 RepID=UPI000A1CA9ED|nr:substrate-binding domain-containing protein [Massilibacteroides vaginae]